MLHNFKNKQLSKEKARQIQGGRRPDDVPCDEMAYYVHEALANNDLGAYRYWQKKFGANCL